MGNPFFFELGPHLDTAPGAFLNRAPSRLKILIKLVLVITSARYAMLVGYSFVLFFREKDNGGL